MIAYLWVEYDYNNLQHNVTCQVIYLRLFVWVVAVQEQNVFDSKKKIKVATADSLKQKLTWSQRRTIAMNECLLYMYTGQVMIPCIMYVI